MLIFCGLLLSLKSNPQLKINKLHIFNWNLFGKHTF